MTIEHKDIPDGFRHEPKGISTAPQDTVYTSDGAGSGSWSPVSLAGQGSSLEGQIAVANGDGTITWKHSPQGWAYHKGNATVTVGSNWSRLFINSADSSTNTDYLPRQIRGTSDLFINNRIRPIGLGDSYDIRVDIPITSESGTVQEITLQLDISGSDVTPNTPIVSKYVSGGRATPYNISMSFSVFCLDTFVQNGGQFFIKTSGGSVTVSRPAVTIVRTGAGDL